MKKAFLFAIPLLISGFISGCSDSDDPTPPEKDESVNAMVKNLASGEISGEFNRYRCYREKYDETSGEWQDMGVLYGWYPSSPKKFYIVDGIMYYKVTFDGYPSARLDAVEEIWNAYQHIENKHIDLYVVKSFEVDNKTLAFKDFHNRYMIFTTAEENNLTVVNEGRTTPPSCNDKGEIIWYFPEHDITYYAFTPCDAPDLTNSKTFSSINEAYLYVIEYGRENWPQIKNYISGYIRDDIDFDLLEDEFKNSPVIF